MTVKTITNAMTKQAAIETAKQLGSQYSAYGINVNDAEGYLDDAATELNWFVELDDSVIPERIFGFNVSTLLSMQYK